MPDLTARSISTKNPMLYDYTLIGTAAGTTTISSEPAIIHSIMFPNRVASGSVVLYDSIGTSGTSIGTIVLGTQTFSDPPIPYILDVRTKNALSVSNSANLGAVVIWGN